ncbi:MAG: RES family NAD+ phosphorylase [Achromobacter kerstersii]|uniref:RES family NAD+ phosphorylase n=1 Tax=Achromobacter kerstersii TaxID=1353890 RepID=UPI003CFEEFB3
MIALWRLSNSQDLQPRARPAGRWHSAGAPVVVLDANPAAAVFARLALSEVAHPRALPRHYFLLEVKAPGNAVSDVVSEADLPVHWQTDLPATRALGNAWLASGESLLLRVPSAAGGVQYLLNAAHPQLSQCQIVSSVAYPYAPHLAGIARAVREDAAWLAAADAGGGQD